MLLAPLLVLALGISNSGVSIVYHYCCGEVENVEWIVADSGGACTSEDDSCCDESSEKQDNCCTDVVVEPLHLPATNHSARFDVATIAYAVVPTFVVSVPTLVTTTEQPQTETPTLASHRRRSLLTILRV